MKSETVQTVAEQFLQAIDEKREQVMNAHKSIRIMKLREEVKELQRQWSLQCQDQDEQKHIFEEKVKQFFEQIKESRKANRDKAKEVALALIEEQEALLKITTIAEVEKGLEKTMQGWKDRFPTTIGRSQNEFWWTKFIAGRDLVRTHLRKLHQGDIGEMTEIEESFSKIATFISKTERGDDIANFLHQEQKALWKVYRSGNMLNGDCSRDLRKMLMYFYKRQHQGLMGRLAAYARGERSQERIQLYRGVKQQIKQLQKLPGAKRFFVEQVILERYFDVELHQQLEDECRETCMKRVDLIIQSREELMKKTQRKMDVLSDTDSELLALRDNMLRYQKEYEFAKAEFFRLQANTHSVVELYAVKHLQDENQRQEWLGMSQSQRVARCEELISEAGKAVKNALIERDAYIEQKNAVVSNDAPAKRDRSLSKLKKRIAKKNAILDLYKEDLDCVKKQQKN